MNKFKIGDRVRLVVESVEDNDTLRAGMLGTVIEDDSLPCVAWDGWSEGHHGGLRDTLRRDCWAMLEKELELVS